MKKTIKGILISTAVFTLVGCSAAPKSSAPSGSASSATSTEETSSTTEETTEIMEIGGTTIDDMKENPDKYIGKAVSFSAFFVEGDQVGMIASVLGPGDIKYVGASDTCEITVSFREEADTSSLTYVEKKSGIIDSFDAMRKNTALVGKVDSISEIDGVLKIGFALCDFKSEDGTQKLDWLNHE